MVNSNVLKSFFKESVKLFRPMESEVLDVARLFIVVLNLFAW